MYLDSSGIKKSINEINYEIPAVWENTGVRKANSFLLVAGSFNSWESLCKVKGKLEVGITQCQL